MFTILPEFEKLYIERINEGFHFLKSKKVVVTGLARNISINLYNNIASIDNLRPKCSELHYFIYENDSSDDTDKALENTKNKIQNFNYKSESLQLKEFTHTKLDNLLELKSLERTTNLARHRNTCKDYIKDNLNHTDFVIVIDLDFQKFSLDGVINSFGWISNNYVDALVGNSFEFKRIFSDSAQESLWNYDCWAYRGSWWEDLQKYSKSYNYDPMMWFGFWQLPIGSYPVLVNSAFGGIGIYKTSDFISVNYDGYDCEHVCFHKNLKNKYPNFRLGLNPSQLMLF